MESELDVQAVENFLRLAKGANNKEDFMARVRQFDQKFVDAYPSPTMTPLPNIPKANSTHTPTYQKQPPVPEPVRNPFLNPNEDKFRQQRQISTPNPYSTAPNQFQPMYQPPAQPTPTRRPNPPPTIPHSRSETNFYRQQPEPYDNLDPSAQLYQEQALYRQNMLDRSAAQLVYGNQQGLKASYQQPYIQGNEFLSSYEAEEPQYAIPQPNPKAQFAPIVKTNPFK